MAEPSGNRREDRWHMGREIPVIIVLTVLTQTGAMIWGAATLTGEVGRLRGDVVRLDASTAIQAVLIKEVALLTQRVEINTNRIEAMETLVISNTHHLRKRD